MLETDNFYSSGVLMDNFIFQVFDEVQSLVTSCVDGFNVCIFAYGQTGSGKTFTMEVRNKWHLTHLAIDYFQT